jgi:tRNA threonylcarbamoyladenosine biosynthesis protein TsaE
MTTVRIKNQDAMKAYAADLVARTSPGTVIGLVGDLGAGKTTLTQYMADALGVERAVKSPTFILLQERATGATAKERGIVRLWHADAYRIERERDMWTAGLAEATGDTEAVTIVEWADKLPSLASVPSYKQITITFGDGDERIVSES